jgi:hypothetical protein
VALNTSEPNIPKMLEPEESFTKWLQFCVVSHACMFALRTHRRGGKSGMVQRGNSTIKRAFNSSLSMRSLITSRDRKAGSLIATGLSGTFKMLAAFINKPVAQRWTKVLRLLSFTVVSGRDGFQGGHFRENLCQWTCIKNMKLFQSAGIYPAYLPRLNSLAADAKTFHERIDAFLEDRYGACHCLQPVLSQDPSAFFANGNDDALQRFWAIEQNYSSLN